jgi:hypothetical protein
MWLLIIQGTVVENVRPLLGLFRFHSFSSKLSRILEAESSRDQHTSKVQYVADIWEELNQNVSHYYTSLRYVIQDIPLDAYLHSGRWKQIYINLPKNTNQNILKLFVN